MFAAVDRGEPPDRRCCSGKARRRAIFVILVAFVFAAGMSLSVLISTGVIDSLLQGGRLAAIERVPPPAVTAAGPIQSTGRASPGETEASETEASNVKFEPTTEATHDRSHESSLPYQPIGASSHPPSPPSLTEREARLTRARQTGAAESPTAETGSSTVETTHSVESDSRLSSTHGQSESIGKLNEGAGEGVKATPTSEAISSSSSTDSGTATTRSTSSGLLELGGSGRPAASISDDIYDATTSFSDAPIRLTGTDVTASSRSGEAVLFSIAGTPSSAAASARASKIASPSADDVQRSSTGAFGSSSAGAVPSANVDTTTYSRSGSTKPPRTGVVVRSSETFSTGDVVSESTGAVTYYATDEEPALRTSTIAPSGDGAATPPRNGIVTSSSTDASVMPSAVSIMSPSSRSGSVGSSTTGPTMSVSTVADTSSSSTSEITFSKTIAATSSGTGEGASSISDASTSAGATTPFTTSAIESSRTSSVHSASSGITKTSSVGPVMSSSDGSIASVGSRAATYPSTGVLTSSSIGRVAPSTTGAVMPSASDMITSATTSEATSSSTGEVASSSNGISSSSRTRVSMPTSTDAATPSSTAEIISSSTAEITSSSTAEIASSSTAEIASSSTAESTSSSTAESTSSSTAESTSSSTAEIASSSTAESTSSSTAEIASSSTAEIASSSTAEIASSTGALSASRTATGASTADAKTATASTAITTTELRAPHDRVTKPPPPPSHVISTSPRCTMASKEILDEGGSAIDGAIAAQLCEGLEEPQSGGVGGGLYINVYNETSKESVIFNAREIAWAAAIDDQQYEASEVYAFEGGPAIAVPGAVAGYWEAWKRFGRTPWKQLFDRTIAWCDEGLAVSAELADHLAGESEALRRSEAFRQEFFNNATTPAVGKVVHRSRYCRTLRRIAEDPQSFYRGVLAEDILRDVADEGSTWAAADLSQYAVVQEQPIRYGMDKAGFALLVPFWPSEAMSVAQAVQYIDWYGVNASMALASTEDANFLWHQMVESLRYGVTFKGSIGDPRILSSSEEYGRVFVTYQNQFKAVFTSPYYVSDRVRPVRLYHLNIGLPESYIVQEDAGERTAVHTSVVDNAGLAVSASGSIGFRFGCKRMGRRTGIIFNSAMAEFTKVARGAGEERSNWIAPGARPSSSLVPAIVVDQDGRVRMVIGSAAGSRGLSALTWTIFNAMALKMSLRDAIARPRFHPRPWSREIEYEDGVSQERVSDLESRFHEPVKVARIGFVTGLLKRSDSTWESCTDPRNRTSATSLPYATAAPTGPTRTTHASRRTTPARRSPPTTEALGTTLRSSVDRGLMTSYDPEEQIAAPIPGGVRVGGNVRVRGIPTDEQYTFTISIQEGVRDSVNKALILRFDSRSPEHDVVLRESMVNRKMTFPERYGRPSSFRIGQPFEVRVHMDSDRFRIFIDGEYYTHYMYRLPLSTINTIIVQGALSQPTFEYF